MPACGAGFWRNAPAFVAKQASAQWFWRGKPLYGVKGAFLPAAVLCSVVKQKRRQRPGDATVRVLRVFSVRKACVTARRIRLFRIPDLGAFPAADAR